jgi:peptide/nickel transport system ATP-binding protein
MYAGKKVEEADVIDLFDRPLHPYTRALMASMPAMNTASTRLTEIPGLVPAAHELGRGCAFAARCSHARERCRVETPQLTQQGGDHVVACFAVEEHWAHTTDAPDAAEVAA